MTRPYLVPFKAEHMLEFVNRDTNTRAEFAYALTRERGGPAFTARVGEDILGCAGVILQWPGVGYVWVALDKRAAQYGVWITRTVRHILNDVIRIFNLHRVEAVVLSDDLTNLRWIQTLGFKIENDIAQMYTTDKRDVVRFELIS